MVSPRDGVVIAGAPPPTTRLLSHNALVRVLHACFFLLGMGLMAPITAILQTMDYLNIFFAEYYPSRTLYTGYNTTNLITLVILFQFGERLWPNKRRRLLTGYSLYTAILVTLPVVDYVLMDHKTAMASKAALQLTFALWAVGSCTAGMADALISTVAYSQAAAIGQRFTHAFVGGRATSGLVMAALRCLSKGALAQNLAGLKQSTFIYVLIAAMIVFMSVIIAGIILPRLGPQIEQFKERRGAPAGAKVQIKTHEKCTFCRLQEMGPPPAAEPAASFAEADGPLKSLPIPPVGPLSAWGSGMPLLPTQTHAGDGAAAAAAAPQRQLGMHCSRLSTWTRPLASTPSTDLQERQHMSSLSAVVDAALPAAAGGSADVHRQSPIAEEVEEGSCHSTSTSSSSSSSTPRADIDANVTVLSAAAGARAEPAGSAARPEEGKLPELIRANPADASSGLDQHMVVYLQSYMHAASNVATELGRPATHRPHHPQCTCGKRDPSKDAATSLPDSSVVDSDNASSSNGSSDASSKYDDSWGALFKVVWPFCLAVQPAPMTTATILPLNLSAQIAHWPVVTASRWHVQIMMVTVQLGFFLGSAILPIRTPRRPRVSLPVLACLIFIFGPIFAAALMANAPPYAFLVLALCMHTYSGYMTSTVFCVASQGFASKEVIRVQQLLVLSMGVSYVIGSCISWIWVFIGKA